MAHVMQWFPVLLLSKPLGISDAGVFDLISAHNSLCDDDKAVVVETINGTPYIPLDNKDQLIETYNVNLIPIDKVAELVETSFGIEMPVECIQNMCAASRNENISAFLSADAKIQSFVIDEKYYIPAGEIDNFIPHFIAFGNEYETALEKAQELAQEEEAELERNREDAEAIAREEAEQAQREAEEAQKALEEAEDALDEEAEAEDEDDIDPHEKSKAINAKEAADNAELLELAIKFREDADKLSEKTATEIAERAKALAESDAENNKAYDANIASYNAEQEAKVADSISNTPAYVPPSESETRQLNEGYADSWETLKARRAEYEAQLTYETAAEAQKKAHDAAIAEVNARNLSTAADAKIAEEARKEAEARAEKLKKEREKKEAAEKEAENKKVAEEKAKRDKEEQAKFGQTAQPAHNTGETTAQPVQNTGETNTPFATPTPTPSFDEHRNREPVDTQRTDTFTKKEDHYVENKTGEGASLATPITETTKVEPKKEEPIKAETVQTEPAKAETINTEPIKTEPVKTESVHTEPIKTETAKVETVNKPVDTELVKTETTKAEPVKTEPVQTDAGSFTATTYKESNTVAQQGEIPPARKEETETHIPKNNEVASIHKEDNTVHPYKEGDTAPPHKEEVPSAYEEKPLHKEGDTAQPHKEGVSSAYEEKLLHKEENTPIIIPIDGGTQGEKQPEANIGAIYTPPVKPEEYKPPESHVGGETVKSDHKETVPVAIPDSKSSYEEPKAGTNFGDQPSQKISDYTKTETPSTVETINADTGERKAEPAPITRSDEKGEYKGETNPLAINSNPYTPTPTPAPTPIATPQPEHRDANIPLTREQIEGNQYVAGTIIDAVKNGSLDGEGYREGGNVFTAGMPNVNAEALVVNKDGSATVYSVPNNESSKQEFEKAMAVDGGQVVWSNDSKTFDAPSTITPPAPGSEPLARKNDYQPVVYLTTVDATGELKIHAVENTEKSLSDFNKVAAQNGYLVVENVPEIIPTTKYMPEVQAPQIDKKQEDIPVIKTEGKQNATYESEAESKVESKVETKTESKTETKAETNAGIKPETVSEKTDSTPVGAISKEETLVGTPRKEEASVESAPISTARKGEPSGESVPIGSATVDNVPTGASATDTSPINKHSTDTTPISTTQPTTHESTIVQPVKETPSSNITVAITLPSGATVEYSIKNNPESIATAEKWATDTGAIVSFGGASVKAEAPAYVPISTVDNTGEIKTTMVKNTQQDIQTFHENVIKEGSFVVSNPEHISNRYTTPIQTSDKGYQSTLANVNTETVGNIGNKTVGGAENNSVSGTPINEQAEPKHVEPHQVGKADIEQTNKNIADDKSSAQTDINHSDAISNKQGEDSTAKSEHVAIKGEDHSANAETPTAKDENSTIKGEAPVAKSEVPATKSEAPTTKSEAPVAKDETPATKAETVATKAETPTAKDEILTSKPNSGVISTEHATAGGTDVDKPTDNEHKVGTTPIAGETTHEVAKATPVETGGVEKQKVDVPNAGAPTAPATEGVVHTASDNKIIVSATLPTGVVATYTIDNTPEAKASVEAWSKKNGIEVSFANSQPIVASQAPAYVPITTVNGSGELQTTLVKNSPQDIQAFQQNARNDGQLVVDNPQHITKQYASAPTDNNAIGEQKPTGNIQREKAEDTRVVDGKPAQPVEKQVEAAHSSAVGGIADKNTPATPQKNVENKGEQAMDRAQPSNRNIAENVPATAGNTDNKQDHTDKQDNKQTATTGGKQENGAQPARDASTPVKASTQESANDKVVISVKLANGMSATYTVPNTPEAKADVQEWAHKNGATVQIQEKATPKEERQPAKGETATQQGEKTTANKTLGAESKVAGTVVSTATIETVSRVIVDKNGIGHNFRVENTPQSMEALNKTAQMMGGTVVPMGTDNATGMRIVEIAGKDGKISVMTVGTNDADTRAFNHWAQAQGATVQQPTLSMKPSAENAGVTSNTDKPVAPATITRVIIDKNGVGHTYSIQNTPENIAKLNDLAKTNGGILTTPTESGVPTSKLVEIVDKDGNRQAIIVGVGEKQSEALARWANKQEVNIQPAVSGMQSMHVANNTPAKQETVVLMVVDKNGMGHAYAVKNTPADIQKFEANVKAQGLTTVALQGQHATFKTVEVIDKDGKVQVAIVGNSAENNIAFNKWVQKQGMSVNTPTVIGEQSVKGFTITVMDKAGKPIVIHTDGSARSVQKATTLIKQQGYTVVKPYVPNPINEKRVDVAKDASARNNVKGNASKNAVVAAQTVALQNAGRTTQQGRNVVTKKGQTGVKFVYAGSNVKRNTSLNGSIGANIGEASRKAGREAWNVKYKVSSDGEVVNPNAKRNSATYAGKDKYTVAQSAQNRAPYMTIDLNGALSSTGARGINIATRRLLQSEMGRGTASLIDYSKGAMYVVGAVMFLGHVKRFNAVAGASKQARTLGHSAPHIANGRNGYAVFAHALRNRHGAHEMDLKKANEVIAKLNKGLRKEDKIKLIDESLGLEIKRVTKSPLSKPMQQILKANGGLYKKSQAKIVAQIKKHPECAKELYGLIELKKFLHGKVKDLSKLSDAEVAKLLRQIPADNPYSKEMRNLIIHRTGVAGFGDFRDKGIGKKDRKGRVRLSNKEMKGAEESLIKALQQMNPEAYKNIRQLSSEQMRNLLKSVKSEEEKVLLTNLAGIKNISENMRNAMRKARNGAFTKYVRKSTSSNESFSAMFELRDKINMTRRLSRCTVVIGKTFINIVHVRKNIVNGKLAKIEARLSGKPLSQRRTARLQKKQAKLQAKHTKLQGKIDRRQARVTKAKKTAGKVKNYIGKKTERLTKPVKKLTKPIKRVSDKAKKFVKKKVRRVRARVMANKWAMKKWFVKRFPRLNSALAGIAKAGGGVAKVLGAIGGIVAKIMSFLSTIIGYILLGVLILIAIILAINLLLFLLGFGGKMITSFFANIWEEDIMASQAGKTLANIVVYDTAFYKSLDDMSYEAVDLSLREKEGTAEKQAFLDKFLQPNYKALGFRVMKDDGGDADGWPYDANYQDISKGAPEGDPIPTWWPFSDRETYRYIIYNPGSPYGRGGFVQNIYDSDGTTIARYSNAKDILSVGYSAFDGKVNIIEQLVDNPNWGSTYSGYCKDLWEATHYCGFKENGKECGTQFTLSLEWKWQKWGILWVYWTSGIKTSAHGHITELYACADGKCGRTIAPNGALTDATDTPNTYRYYCNYLALDDASGEYYTSTDEQRRTQWVYSYANAGLIFKNGLKIPMTYEITSAKDYEKKVSPNSAYIAIVDNGMGKSGQLIYANDGKGCTTQYCSQDTTAFTPAWYGVTARKYWGTSIMQGVNMQTGTYGDVEYSIASDCKATSVTYCNGIGCDNAWTVYHDSEAINNNTCASSGLCGSNYKYYHGGHTVMFLGITYYNCFPAGSPTHSACYNYGAALVGIPCNGCELGHPAGEAHTFYRCLGHGSCNGFVICGGHSQCEGHYACPGHDMIYCRGHVNIETNVVIVGINDSNAAPEDEPIFKIVRDPEKKFHNYKNWTKTSMEYTTNIYEGDWEELYNISFNASNTAETNITFPLSPAEVKSAMGTEILTERQKKIVRYALESVGNITYHPECACRVNTTKFSISPFSSAKCQNENGTPNADVKGRHLNGFNSSEFVYYILYVAGVKSGAYNRDIEDATEITNGLTKVSGKPQAGDIRYQNTEVVYISPTVEGEFGKHVFEKFSMSIVVRVYENSLLVVECNEARGTVIYKKVPISGVANVSYYRP